MKTIDQFWYNWDLNLLFSYRGNDGKEGNKKNQILYSEIQSKTTYTDEANRPESLGKWHSSDCPTSGSEIQNDSVRVSPGALMQTWNNHSAFLWSPSHYILV